MSTSRLPAALVAAAVFVLSPNALRGQQGDEAANSDVAQVDLVAYRLDTGIQIDLDGQLQEAVWDEAIPITDFTQKEPVEGGRPSQETEIRVLYDEDALYIGAILYDDPAGILAFQKGRDVGLGTDDRFMWILDTFGNGRTGYFFETNAAGLMGDGQLSGTGGGGGFGGGGRGGGGGGGKAWDGIWEVRTHIRPDGWSIEVQIPFRTLNFDPEAVSWGINFQRTIRRKNEEIVWRGFRRNQQLRSPVHAGQLVGLSQISQGIGLEVTPYAVTNWKNVPDNLDPTTYPSDIGFDVSYSLTPSLRAGVSVNTDFAEAEVDDRRINLTRFPQRFQERRDFFIEGADVFSFAPRNGVEPYFSRKIGLLEGEQIPVNYAARLGGQAGRWQMGLIHVGTGDLQSIDVDTGFLPSEMFTAARVKSSILEQSTVGAIYTRRSTEIDPTTPGAVAPADRHTAGVDANFFTSRLFGSKNFQIEGFYVWNSNPDPAIDRTTGDLTARGFRVNYPNDVWSGHVSYRELGDDYDPAVGFVTRNGIRRVEPRVGWSPRPDIDWLRQLNFSAQFRHTEDVVTGVNEEQELQFQVLGLRFESQDNLSFRMTRLFEFLDEEFEIEDDIFIAPGDYTNWEWTVEARTANRRRVSADVEFGRGGFWDGDRTRLEGGVQFRPQPGIQLGVEAERNQVDLSTDLRSASFPANLYRVEGGWDINPLISLSGNMQYDDVSEVVGFFARTRWILKPGNELFIVLTQNWQNLGMGLFERDRDLVTLSRGASIKLNYTVRF